MIGRSMMAVSPGSRRSHSCLRQKKAQPETLAAASTTPSHTAIIPVPQGRTSAPCSQRLSQRLCTLLAAAFTTPSRPAALLAVLLAVACSGPGSYEEFVRAEDVTGGVYEFVIPSAAKESGEAKEPSLRAMAPLGGKSAATYDLSFYTAPLDEPLQLEITWYSVEANQLNTNKLPETPLQPELSRRFCESADNQAVTLHAIRRETVWFPAGQHKALYRSGVKLASAEASPSGSSLRSPHHPSGTVPPLSNRGCYVPEGEASAPVALRVRPVNPPEDFRGLGIIIKRNDGTR